MTPPTGHYYGKSFQRLVTHSPHGNFIDISGAGITVRSENALGLGGSDIFMSKDAITGWSGGSAGSGNYQMPADPLPPLLPE
jgi:hypothetical protein